MSKKVEKKDSVVVDVDTDVTTSTTSVVGGEECIDTQVVSKRKSTSKSKKVADVALESRIAELEDALVRSNDALESALAENERLSDSLSTSVVETKSLRKELSKCKQDFKKVQADNRANSALVETLDGELTRFKVRNDELTKTISNLQDNIKKKNEDLLAKDSEICALTNERNDFFDKISDLSDKLWVCEHMSLWDRIKFVVLGKRLFMKVVKS